MRLRIEIVAEAAARSRFATVSPGWDSVEAAAAAVADAVADAVAAGAVDSRAAAAVAAGIVDILAVGILASAAGNLAVDSPADSLAAVDSLEAAVDSPAGAAGNPVAAGILVAAGEDQAAEGLAVEVAVAEEVVVAARLSYLPAPSRGRLWVSTHLEFLTLLDYQTPRTSTKRQTSTAHQSVETSGSSAF